MRIIDDIKLQYKIGGIANKFIYWNVGCFLVSLVFYKFKEGLFDFPVWLALYANPKTTIIFPWTLFTYAFLHDGFWHLFWNMLVLNFYSRLFTTFFTNKQYVGLYFLSAIFSGVVFVILYPFFGNSLYPVVGASGAIMGILVATTVYQPLMEIRLFLIGNIKLWHLTGVILLLDFMSVGLGNSGGEIVHLSAAFFGFLYIKLLQNGTDLSVIVSKFIDFFINLFSKKEKIVFKKVHVNPKKTIKPQESKIVIKDENQQQIDAILDKISKSGYDSLNQSEKEFLFKAGGN